MTQAALKQNLDAIICKACGAASHQKIGHKNGYDLLQCETCETVMVDPWPTVEDLTAFYQEYKGTPNYLAKKDKKMKRAARRIAKLKRLQVPGKKLLDVGCNAGYIVAAARDAGLDAFGIDIDDDTINVAKQEFGEGCFANLSVEDYAKKGEKADIIYTSEVIEHVPDPDGFVAALAEILNPKGQLYLTTPAACHFRVPKDFTDWQACTPPEHITYFTKKGLATLLKKHGFIDIRFALNLKPGIKLLAVRG